MNTRDPREFLAPLASLAQNVTCLAIPGQDASLSANELCSAAQDIGLEAQSAASLQAALTKAHNGTHTPAPATPIIICGSLYLAGHDTVWGKNDLKPAITTPTGPLEDQDAVLSRSKPGTVPVSLRV